MTGGPCAGAEGPAGLSAAVIEQVPTLLLAIRARRPLVHVFGNFVTMQATANVIRAVGALPVMAMARDDAVEMAGQADALVLSLGTPTPDRLEAMLAAGRAAAAREIPIVLDPVGVGSTGFRNRAAGDLLAHLPVTVVRANRGEAASLLGVAGQVRGVESTADGDPNDHGALAAALARRLGCVVAVTGPRDCVAGGDRRLTVEGGHPWLAAASGTGCMVTALVGAFCAVGAAAGADRLASATAALATFAAAAERAARRADGPGTLVPHLIDSLYHLTPEQARQAVRITEA